MSGRYIFINIPGGYVEDVTELNVFSRSENQVFQTNKTNS